MAEGKHFVLAKKYGDNSGFGIHGLTTSVEVAKTWLAAASALYTPELFVYALFENADISIDGIEPLKLEEL